MVHIPLFRDYILDWYLSYWLFLTLQQKDKIRLSCLNVANVTWLTRRQINVKPKTKTTNHCVIPKGWPLTHPWSCVVITFLSRSKVPIAWRVFVLRVIYKKTSFVRFCRSQWLISTSVLHDWACCSNLTNQCFLDAFNFCDKEKHSHLYTLKKARKCGDCWNTSSWILNENSRLRKIQVSGQ